MTRGRLLFTFRRFVDEAGMPSAPKTSSVRSISFVAARALLLEIHRRPCLFTQHIQYRCIATTVIAIVFYEE